MCELSSKDLYLALIDDINEYTGKIKNEEIENKENCYKLEHAISVLYNLKTGKNVKIYLRKLLDILNNIKYQFDEVKIFTECSDDDFYLSYGVLCAIFCIFKQDKSDGTFEIFDGFDIDNFRGISKIIKENKDIEKLRKFYLVKLDNFVNNILNNKLDNKYYLWFTILVEKDLDSIPIIIKDTKKKKKKKKKPKINDIKGHNTIDNKNKDLNVDSNKDKIINKVNIENIEEKNEDNKEMSPNEQKKFQNCDTTLIKENKSNNYIWKKNISNDEIMTQNANIHEISNTKENDFQNININEISNKKEIESQNINTDKISNKKVKESQIGNKNVLLSIEKNKSINKNDTLLKEENNIQNNIRSDILLTGNIISQTENKEGNKLNMEYEHIKNDEINNIFKQIKESPSLFTQKETLMFNLLEKFNDELKESKIKYESLQQRIDLLEKHQALLYNQIALYQTSRDNGKSIFFYLYKYFELNGDRNLFDKTKKIFQYLDSKDKTDKLTQTQKIALNKFLKILFFVNRYHNKILHKQLKTKTLKLIKEIQKRDKNFSVFPDFNYNQFIESIKYFIENVQINEEIQAVLYDEYENYSLDKGLGAIFDSKKEVITSENETILFKIKKEEVDEAINYLNSVKIKDSTLEDLCDMTTWDKSN